MLLLLMMMMMTGGIITKDEFAIIHFLDVYHSFPIQHEHGDHVATWSTRLPRLKSNYEAVQVRDVTKTM